MRALGVKLICSNNIKQKLKITIIITLMMALAIGSNVEAIEKKTKSEVEVVIAYDKKPSPELAQEAEEFKEITEQRLKAIKEKGFNQEILNNVKIWVTTYQLMPGEKDNIAGYCDIRLDDDGKYSGAKIAIKMGTSEGVLYHEIGHIVEYLHLGVYRYDWINTNKLGSKYIKIKDYKEDLDREYQQKLDWGLRVSEWFAEDVKQILSEEIGAISSNWSMGPEITEVEKTILKPILFKLLE